MDHRDVGIFVCLIFIVLAGLWMIEATDRLINLQDQINLNTEQSSTNFALLDSHANNGSHIVFVEVEK